MTVGEKQSHIFPVDEKTREIHKAQWKGLRGNGEIISKSTGKRFRSNG